MDCTEECFLYLSVDSQYTVWINGVLVSFGQYPDFPHYKVYDKLNITDYIMSGENKIAILAYYCGEDFSTYVRGKAGVIFEIFQQKKLILTSSKNTHSRLSIDYKNGSIEKFSPQLSFSFNYNYNFYDGWEKTDYIINKSWSNAVEQLSSKNFKPRPIHKMALGEKTNCYIVSQGIFYDHNKRNSTSAERIQYAYMSFRNLKEMSKNIPPFCLPSESGLELLSEDGENIYIIIDLQKEVSGFLSMDIDVPENTQIDIAFGEHLDDLRVRALVGPRFFGVRYTAKEGRQSYENYLRRIGCRFLQVHFHCSRAKIHYFGVVPSDYPFKKLYFNISDLLHQKIFDVSINTLNACAHEHYEDCIWREQALYSMDGRNQMLCGLYAFDNNEYPKANIRLLSLGIREDGLLNLCAPSKMEITIPSFSLIWIIQLWEYILYTADLEFAEEMLPTAEKIILTFISRMDKECLVSCFTDENYWNFYDWAEGIQGGKSYRNFKIPETLDAPLNALLSCALSSISEIYKYCGLNKLSNKYLVLKSKLNNSFHKSFYNEDKKMYATFIKDKEDYHYCELTQALAVYCDACPSDYIDDILMKLSMKSSILIKTTLSYNIFKFEALLKRPEMYGEYVFKEISEIYGNMLYKNATTFWETEKGGWDFGNAGSLCHGWSAIAVYFYYAYALGIKPKTVGFEEISVNPVKSGISQIHADLKFSDKRFTAFLKDGYTQIRDSKE